MAVDRLFSKESCALETIHLEGCLHLSHLVTDGVNSQERGRQIMRLTTLTLISTSITLNEVAKLIAPSECCLKELAIHSSIVPLKGDVFHSKAFNLTRLSLQDNRVNSL